jgi:hypothetical protein
MEMIKVKNMLGYGNELNAMRKAKLDKTLDKYYRYNGSVLHSYEFIINRILEGATLEIEDSYYSAKLEGYTKPKTLYKLVDEDSSYSEVSKTEYNFAEWLVSNNIKTIDKVREFEILEDNRVKENDRLENEKAEKELQEKLRKEQEEKEFAEWLNNSYKNYNNAERIDLAKTIYENEIEQSNIDLCKKVLFLIENIDNVGCRKDLMSRLRNHNPASRKVFYHITGIRLPQTDKATIELLQNISSNDYKGLINYNRKADREEQQKEMIKFYRKNKNGISLAEGEELKNKYDMQLYITFDAEKDYYIIVEARTGMTLISGDRNKAKLLKAFKERMTDDLVKRVKEQIEYLVNTNGELPKAM